jgi:hypothetical protein
MPAATKAKHKLSGFLFAHRGVKNYPGLISHYKTSFRLAQPEVVRLTGTSPRTVAKWAQGESPSPKQQKALVEMDRLLDALGRIMEPAQIGKWLKTPNQAFDGSTPLQVIEHGQGDRIWRMIYYIESGQPG